VLLLALLGLGILLHFATGYAAFHPSVPDRIVSISFTVLGLVVLLIPVVLWRMRGDPPLRIVVGAIWLTYLFLWGVAVYQMMND